MEMFKGKIYGNVISQPELPLMSCIIVSYNNVNFLYDAIKSVLGQNYGNYEIVISDDASAKFTVQDIGKQVCKAAFDLMFEQENGCLLVDKNKQFEEWADKCTDFLAAALRIVKEYFPKIKKIVIRKNEKNLGTVKHLIQAKKEINGKYLMFMAADDKLYDSMVIADEIGYFEKLPEDVFALASQCAMCDNKLNKMFSYFVTDEVKDLINNGTSEQLYAELTIKSLLPASLIYKTKVFETFGDFDGEYHLVEDWTYFLKITRQGCKIAYYDRLSYLHRDGGISHGNSVGGSIALRYYFEDCIHAWHKEIFPYMEKLNLKQRRASLHEYKYHIETYVNIFLKMGATNNIPKIEPVQIFNIGTVCLVISFLISCLKISGPNISFLYYLFGILGMVLFCFSFFMEIFILSSVCLKKIISMFLKGRKIG